MRLIDAHKLLDDIETNKDTVDIVDIVESIIMSPTVDAVPVIRCKDCKWLDRDITSIGTFLICNAVSNGGTKFFPEDDKWFCPKAERKEE